MEAQLAAFALPPSNGSTAGYEPEDLGNFIALLLVVDPNQWTQILAAYLNRGMAKNVKWCCRNLALAGKARLIGLYQRQDDGTFTDADKDEFLLMAFQSSGVSRRSCLFWASLRRALAASAFSGDRAAMVHGFRPTAALRRSVAVELAAVMQVDSWPRLFAALCRCRPWPPFAVGALCRPRI